jgi:hypothetical protein
MRHAHYSTTQRYLHHQPRPEHARLLQEAFEGSAVVAQSREVNPVAQ